MAYAQLLRKLAGQIYDLDEEVYDILGSILGRVFNDDREKSIKDMMEIMKKRNDAHILRSDLALIGNMIRTIPDEKVREEKMAQYNDILQQVRTLPTSFGEVDIQDPELARLNESNPEDRFGGSDHLVICISRSYGAAASDIGFHLADDLQINFYDDEILEQVEKRFQTESEGKIRNFFKYHGLSKGDAQYFSQSQLICDKARSEDFVIMGRCAHEVLTSNHIPHISIFITAPKEQRVKHVMEINAGMSEKKALKLLNMHDRKRRRYYNFYTQRELGDVANYDLCINSAVYGLEGALEMIGRILPEQLEVVQNFRARQQKKDSESK